MRVVKSRERGRATPLHCPLSEIPEFIPNIYTCKLVFHPTSIYNCLMNPYAVKAEELSRLAKTVASSEGRTLKTMEAQTQSNLAIAFELRTANILTLEARLTKRPSENEHLIVEVSERLGYDLDVELAH